MRLKNLWSSRREARGAAGWGWLTVVIVVVIAATAACSSAASSNPISATQAKANQTRSAVVLNPAAHQMAQLNFLLGDYTCLTAPVPGVGRLTMHESTRKILDGNYYQMVIQLPFPGAGTLSAYWTLGWDSIDHTYIAQYFDNNGTIGTTTSPGWQNGHFMLTGPYIDVLKGGGASGRGDGFRVTSRDDLVKTGPNKYTDSSSWLKNGHWTAADTLQCQKAS